MAVVMFCALLWSIYAVATFKFPSANLNSTSINEGKGEIDQIKYLIGIAVVEFVIEIALCAAICYVRSKVTPCGNPERTLESRIASEHLEYEMVRQRENSTDDSEMPNRAEEISTVAEPAVDEGTYSTAYDTNRLNAIRERIRRADEDEGTNFLFWNLKPFP